MHEHHDPSPRHRRPAQVLVAVLAAMALTTTACGSRSDRALRRAAEFGNAAASRSVEPGASLPEGPAPAAAAGGKKSEIVLGAFGAESGVIGSVFASIPPADRAWAADINARGGLNGHPVRLIMGDDGADPVRSQALVRRMVEQDHVLAIF